MKSKKLLVTALAGALIVGSLSVNASSLTKDVTQLGEAIMKTEKVTTSAAMASNSNLSDVNVNQGLEMIAVSTSKLTGENDGVAVAAIRLSELPEEHQDKLINEYEHLAKDMEAATLALPAQVRANTENPIETIEFSDLPQEVQDKLIERFGDLATEMQFLDTEEAERIASFDSTQSIAIPATALKAAK
ncbi:hypothetical protein [Vallitalea okinawensis]|uniref:hypothetical protein n=1 Tax=Vallitalea okinawensis TaxID=2078660 RepID=UPI000CFCA272|nr:hypothetical protein [Vallitalea okinawensis]